MKNCSFEICAGDADSARASELIDELCGARAKIDVEGLGGGLWLSRFVRGPEPRWQRQAKIFKFNKVGQTYDPETSRVRNYGEVLGPCFAVFAEGSYEPFRATKEPVTAPLDVDVSIDKGGLLVAGLSLGLPIKGPGLLRIHYLDSRLRIFESPPDAPTNDWETNSDQGLFVVQLRQDALEEYYEQEQLR